MKEIFTEEEYQDAIRGYNEMLEKEYYADKNNYKVAEGFIDLRNYNLDDDDFHLLWRFQDMLSSLDCRIGIINPNNPMFNFMMQETYEGLCERLIGSEQ